jgi:hypothetical protein
MGSRYQAKVQEIDAEGGASHLTELEARRTGARNMPVSKASTAPSPPFPSSQGLLEPFFNKNICGFFLFPFSIPSFFTEISSRSSRHLRRVRPRPEMGKHRYTKRNMEKEEKSWVAEASRTLQDRKIQTLIVGHENE